MKWTVAETFKVEETVDPSNEKQGLGEVIKDVADNMKKGIGKATIKIKLKAEEERKMFSPDEAGVIVDHEVGIELGNRVQELAKENGWEGPLVSYDTEEEAKDTNSPYWEATALAVDFLNTVAPANYEFVFDEDNDFGLFEVGVSNKELNPDLLKPSVPEMAIEPATEEVAHEEEKEVAPTETELMSIEKGAPMEQHANFNKTAATFSPEDAGPWIMSNRGILMGTDIQTEAQKYGWDGPMVAVPEEEGYFDSVKAAEDYLQTIAPDGYRFGMSDAGDFGMWHMQPEDDELTVMKQFASIYKLNAEEPPYAAPVGMRWVKSTTTQDWTLVPDSEAQMMTANKVHAINDAVFGKVTITSEFHEIAFPSLSLIPKIGSMVYVRPMKVMGEVIGIHDNCLRVQASVNGELITNTFYLHELDVK